MASAWKFFNEAKKYLMTGDLDLDSGNFYMSLHTDNWTPDVTLSTYASVGNEVSNANGYTTGGTALTETWASAGNASTWRFSYSNSVYWSANGGTIASVQYAVIYESSGKAMCYSALSTAGFDVTDTNRLTVTPSANGVFELG
jgi:hypothetical protein